MVSRFCGQPVWHFPRPPDTEPHARWRPAYQNFQKLFLAEPRSTPLERK